MYSIGDKILNLLVLISIVCSFLASVGGLIAVTMLLSGAAA